MSLPWLSDRRLERSLLGRVFDRGKKGSRARPSRRKSLHIESLEDRRLLTVQVFGGGPDFQINATAGTQNMSINLDGSDRYTMTLSSGGPFDIVSDPGSLITLDSANQISFDASDFETLFMDFGDGNDTLRFESNNSGYPNSMDISGGSGSDTVINNVPGGAVFDHELRLNVFETIMLNEDLDVTRGSNPIDNDRSTAFFIDQNPFNNDPIALNLAENVDIRTHDGDFNPISTVTMLLEGAGGTNIISADGEVNNTAGTFDPTVVAPVTTASGNAGLDVRSGGDISLPTGGIDINGPFLAAYDTDGDQTLNVSATNPIDAPQVTLTGSGADDSLILGPAVSSNNITLNDWQSVDVGSPLEIALNGTTPGSEYTQLSVEGEVDISGTTLNVAVNFGTSVGNLFVIVDNDGADPIVGTFAGLPEGALITVGMANFTISYAGGDGNDVVLTTTVSPTETSIDIVAGRLVIEDIVVGGKQDTLTVGRDGGDLVITDPNNFLGASVGTQLNPNEIRIPAVLVTALVIDVSTREGQDSLAVDLTGTAIGMPINYDGGADADALTLDGTATDVTHTFTGTTSGGIAADSTTINYTGLEPVFDNLDAVNRVFTFTGGAETITLDNEVAMPGISSIDSTLGESVSFTNPTTSLTINAGTGADIININGIDSAFAATLNINGDGDVNDRINYNSPLLATPAGLALSAEAINLLPSLINTTGPQSYIGAVTLLDNTAITAGVGTVDFNGTVSGGAAFSLSVTAGGTTTFAGGVSGLTSLLAGGGTTAINGGSVATSGNQTYDDAVTIGADTIFTGNNISFNSTLDDDGIGATMSNVTITAATTTTFADTVGAGDSLTSLLINGPGAAAINGGTLTTTADQTYNAATILGNDTQLNAANVSINGTLNDDSVLVTPSNLTINAAVNTIITGSIGMSDPITSLDVSAPGFTLLGAANIITTGDQDYREAVIISSDTILAGNNITFGSTVDDDGVGVTPSHLTVSAAVATLLSDTVGVADRLDRLTVSGPGTTAIGGGLVRTVNSQSYNEPVTLGADTLIDSTNGGVTFGDTVNGAFGLTVTSPGMTTFGGVVGGLAPLASLTVTTAGPFVLGNNMTITGDIGLTVVEGAAASVDDDLRIENSATIRTTTGNILADVGDDATVEAGSTLRADTAGRSITINGDAGSNDTGGSTIIVGGPVFATNVSLNGNAQEDTIDLRVTLAASTTTIDGQADDDTILIGSAANTLDTFAGPIVVTGNTNASAAPGDLLDLNDADDNDVDNDYDLTSTTFTRNGMALLSYDTIETLNLRAGMKDDLIVVMLPDVSLEEDPGTETPLPGVVRVFGNEGHDTVKYTGSDDADTLEIEDVSAVPTVQHQISEVDCLLILAGAGNDVVSNNTAVTSVMGLGAGNDIANGGSGVDVIYGGPGTEIDINAGDGDDFVLPDHDVMGVESISQGDGNPLFIAGGDTINGGPGNDVGFFLTNGVPDKIAGFESGFFDGALIDDVIMWLTAQFLPAAQQGTILSAAITARCANWHSRYVGTNLATISSPGQMLSALDPSADDVWYDFVVESDGILSASGLFDPAGGDVVLTLFDQDFAPLASDYSSDGSALLTQPVTTGQKMYLRVRGANDDVDVTLSVGMPAAPPSVMTVTAGQASSPLSYAMPAAAGAQWDNLPWAIDQLSIQFDQSVDIAAGDLTVTGQDGQTIGLMPAPAGFSYQPATHTATWTLDSPVDDDQLTLTLSDSVQGMFGNSLDGEWTNPTYPGDPTTSTFPSGNGTSGGGFEFGMSILSGDVNQDGAVTFRDVIESRDAMSVAPVRVMADMNGDGSVERGDLVQVIRRFFANLGKPSGAAPSPQAPAALVTAANAVARSDHDVAATVDAAFSTDDQSFASRRSARSSRRSIVASLAQRQSVVEHSIESEVRSLRAIRTSALRARRDSVSRIVDSLIDGDRF